MNHQFLPSRLGLVLLTLGFVVATQLSVAQARAGASALEDSMGDIEWGWTPKQVYQHLAKGVESSYAKASAKAPDAIEEDRLRHKMQEEKRRIRQSYFAFDGTASAYDAGFLKQEFTQNNGEALLRVATTNAQDYFFFINDRLWKRYRAFDSSVFEGASFEEFGAALQKRYGPAKLRRGKLVPNGRETEWYAWTETRVLGKALDNNEFYGFYCLVLEDPKTVAKLDKLRKSPRTADKQGSESLVDLVADQDVGDNNSDIADRISGKIRRQDRPDLKDME